MDSHPQPSQQCAASRSSKALLSEQNRLNTFQSWPKSEVVHPSTLAKAGFYYSGQGDRVRCAFCERTLSSWQRGDDPLVEHRKHFGGCAFIQGRDVGNIPLKENPTPPASTGPEIVGGRVKLNPLYPDYQTVTSREQSFEDGWPPDKVQRPVALADAGFFYIGREDAVRCFCCGAALRSWEPEDIPWVEHARYMPNCPYVLQQKGVDFVSIVFSEQAASPERQTGGQQPHPAASPSSELLMEEDPVLMSSEVVRQVLDMGFDRSLVRSTVHRLFTHLGGQLPQLEELLGALLNGGVDIGPRSAASPVTHGVQETGVGVSSQVLSGSSSEAVAIQGEQTASSDRTLCKICMDREVAVTFQPCGHLVCCAECAVHVKQCPVCRKLIRASIRTYLC